MKLIPAADLMEAEPTRHMLACDLAGYDADGNALVSVEIGDARIAVEARKLFAVSAQLCIDAARAVGEIAS